MADVVDQAPEALCAREPIHIPGAIQPHGWLLAVNAQDFAIEQLSANWESLLPRKAESVIGTAVENLDPQLGARIRQCAAEQTSSGAYRLPILGRSFDVVQHASGGAWIVELEPSTGA